jgi:predicted site-specific integrase-resolvase
MKKLLPSEVAKRLGVKTVTVRAWINQGKFPNAEQEHTEFFHHPVWRIPESDLKDFVKPTQGRPKKPEETKE